MSGVWRRSMMGLVRHRQPKGPATDRPHLNHRVTPRLHIDGDEPDREEHLLPSTFPRVEQDHRTVKKRTWLAKGYGSFSTAWRTLQGIEAVHMIRKGRVRWVAKGGRDSGRQLYR